MTTVINTPGNGDGGLGGLIAGLIIAAVIIVLFFVFGLPAIRSAERDRREADRADIKIEVENPFNDQGEAPQAQ